MTLYIWQRTIRAALVAGALALSGTALADDAAVATVGEPAPDFTLVDATGEKHTLSDFSGKYVVLEWVNFDCPFVRKHYDSQNMQRLQTGLGEKEVVWLSICSSAPGTQGYFEGEALASRLKKEGIKAAAYLIDADGSVGRAYDAKATPHMYVIDPDGVLQYAGAIDDRPSTKVADIEGATNYVVQALDALMAEKEVETTYTKAYGCSIKYAKP